MSKKNRYCKLCGGVISDSRCDQCGKKYFKPNGKIAIYIISAVMILLLSGLLIYQYCRNDNNTNILNEKIQEHESTIKYLDNKIATNNDTIKTFEDKIEENETFIDNLLDLNYRYFMQICFFNDCVVFVNENSNYYYKYDDPGFDKNKSFYAFNVEYAESLGYTPGQGYSG